MEGKKRFEEEEEDLFVGTLHRGLEALEEAEHVNFLNNKMIN